MKRLDNYSQHFLRSPRLVATMIGHTNIKNSDTVLDIGAGSGVISSVLAKRTRQVISIEYEPNAAKKLRKNMEEHANVTVIEGDFVETPLPDGAYKVFANIPFHLSSKIVHKLTEANNIPDSIYLIVQRQFANKLLADGKHFTSQLGAMIGPEWSTRVRWHLKKTDFWPYPNVDTVLIELKQRPATMISADLMPQYRKFVELCFTKPKNFAALSKKYTALPDDTRPSQLSSEQWAVLFNAQRST